MEGKEYQAMKGKSTLFSTLSPCPPLLSLKGSCHINCKKNSTINIKNSDD